MSTFIVKDYDHGEILDILEGDVEELGYIFDWSDMDGEIFDIEVWEKKWAEKYPHTPYSNTESYSVESDPEKGTWHIVAYRNDEYFYQPNDWRQNYAL